MSESANDEFVQAGHTVDAFSFDIEKDLIDFEHHLFTKPMGMGIKANESLERLAKTKENMNAKIKEAEKTKLENNAKKEELMKAVK